MMNIFRLLGDALHLLAIVMLPYKLHKTRSASGVSLKTQELYLLVFLTRYVDLFYRFISTYNTTMKVIYICLTGVAILMIRQQPSLKASYEANLDYFRHWRLAVFPSIAITVLLNVFQEQPRYISFSGQALGELWQFSEVLEPVAMVPQLLLLRQSTDFRKVGWVYRYVSFMAAYRGMYMLNWVFRAYNDFGYRHYPLLYVGSTVQVSLILIFFVEHVTRVDEPLHVLSDEVDIMDSNSFARERLLHRGLGYASDSASTDGVGMESPLRPQSHDGSRFGHDSALTVGGGGAATGSSEAGYGVDGVHIV